MLRAVGRYALPLSTLRVFYMEATCVPHQVTGVPNRYQEFDHAFEVI